MARKDTRQCRCDRAGQVRNGSACGPADRLAAVVADAQFGLSEVGILDSHGIGVEECYGGGREFRAQGTSATSRVGACEENSAVADIVDLMYHA